MRIVTLLNQRIKRCHWSITPLVLAILFLTPLKMFSQSGNLDQIRNGPANNPSKNFWDDFDNPMHVNGNAGASNAHYVESHSISYRSLITGAVVNQQYEYVIEYDTKHSDRMAIDYLTHYQRLEPHQQFGHAAEVINPLIMESGSKEYLMTVGLPDTFSFPVPSSVGSPVPGLPTNSFLALPAAERVMTIWNATIDTIFFISQESLTNGKTESKSRLKVRFRALSDSVLLAWGGHIANRNEWGFLNPTTPRSAGGISGSPYHMRQISMNTFPGNVNISGVGNQDRSLSANAVIAPPDCNISPAQLACPETDSLRFFFVGNTVNTTFLWSIIGANTANAIIDGSATGSSVKIVPNATDFVAGGTFNLQLITTANGLKDTCELTPAATIQNVQVTATAVPLDVDLSVLDTSQLLATVTPGPSDTATYTFLWTQTPALGGQLNNNAIPNPVFTADSIGTYRFIVTVTQRAAPNCVAKDTVFVEVSTVNPPCGISGPDPVCPNTTNTYKFDPDNNGIADTIPDNFTITWSFVGNSNGATLNPPLNDTTVTVTAGADCETSYTLKVVLASTSGLVKDSCTKTINVNVNSELSLTCPRDTTLACGESTDPATSTGTPTVPDNGCGIKVYYTDVITRTWVAVDACGNRDTCTQVIRVDSCITTNTIPNGTARMITSSANPAPATQGVARPATTNPVRSNIKNAPVISPKTTTLNTGNKDLQIQAFPNPFSNTVNFRFVSPVSGRAVLEVYNTQGQRVAIAYDGRVDAGAVKTVQFSTRLTNQALVYKLKVGDKTVRGTVLELKR